MNLYYHIKEAAEVDEFIVCPKPCVLHAITVNKTADGVITIYDGEDEVGILAPNIAEKTYFYDIDIKKYLKVQNVEASDLTVSYRPSGGNVAI